MSDLLDVFHRFGSFNATQISFLCWTALRSHSHSRNAAVAAKEHDRLMTCNDLHSSVLGSLRVCNESIVRDLLVWESVVGPFTRLLDNLGTNREFNSGRGTFSDFHYEGSAWFDASCICHEHRSVTLDLDDIFGSAAINFDNQVILLSCDSLLEFRLVFTVVGRVVLGEVFDLLTVNLAVEKLLKLLFAQVIGELGAFFNYCEGFQSSTKWLAQLKAKLAVFVELLIVSITELFQVNNDFDDNLFTVIQFFAVLKIKLDRQALQKLVLVNFVQHSLLVCKLGKILVHQI